MGCASCKQIFRRDHLDLSIPEIDHEVNNNENNIEIISYPSEKKKK